jgi:hypothetical protein
MKQLFGGDDVGNTGDVPGAVGTDHINQNRRMWPKGSDVSEKHKSWSPKLKGRIRPSGPLFGGPAGRP